MCLPKRPAPGTSLRVIKTITDVGDPNATVGCTLVADEGPETYTCDLVEGEGPGTYTYLSAGGDDCKGPNGEVLPAIIFGDEPQPGEKIEVFYEGDPLLDAL